MTRLHVLRVFMGPDGRGGNPLGVVVDGTTVAPADRQRLAARLGFSETVFIDDPADGAVRIFTPARELPFAGHPLVGTGWLLRRLGHGTDVLRPSAGDVATWDASGLSHIRARAEWVHAIDITQLATAAEVDALTGAPEGQESWYPWAWIDEERGVLRSRYFVRELGIDEDEATGAAAVVMGDLLGRPIEIHQGVGSELYVQPGAARHDRGRRARRDDRDPGAGLMARDADVVVVGLGALGSAAAYWASRRSGLRVVALEQFEIGHPYGASEDVSRIVRLSYHRREYVRLARRAFDDLG